MSSNPNNGAARMTAEALYDFAVIRANTLSPDGAHVAYTVQRIDRKTEKKSNDLWVVAVDGQTPPRRFTYGDSSDSQPRWSPDGRSIAFISNRKDEKQPQIYILPFDGGEARPLTEFDGQLQLFRWSPDGRQLAVLFTEKDADAKERDQDKTKEKLGVVQRHITRVHYKEDGAGWRPQNQPHLYLVDVADGTTRRLTTGDFEIDSFDWFPDGSALVVSTNLDADPDFNPDATQLYRLPLAGDEPHGRDALEQLTDHAGTLFAPVVSPDGRQIAFIGRDEKFNWWQNNSLYVVPAGGGAARRLTPADDLYVGANTNGDVDGGPPANPPTWSADGQTLYVNLTRHGAQEVLAIDVAGGDCRRLLADEVVGRFDVSADGQTLVYFRATERDPGQLCARNLADGTLRQLTAVNGWLPAVPTGEIEEVWFTAADGYKLQGWILKPPGFDPAKKYPSIMEIHGGPQTQYGRIFMHEFHYLAAEGYVVYFSNPRGSQGYGAEHTRAIHGRWGSVDYDDLMAWADYMQQQPYIDGERMGVTGGSYGGYMTTLIIGRTDRFKAAVAQRSVTNWTSMHGTADFNWGWIHLTGDKPPWEDFETNWRHSPVSQIANIKTPTLLIHSLADYRTSFEQSEQVFVALKVLGVDTELVAFPDESHGLSRGGRTDRRIARLRHIARWFNKYLHPDEASV